MGIARYKTPINLLGDLQHEINLLFDGNLNDEKKSDNKYLSQWQPHVDVAEEDKQYVVIADIPGVNCEDIKISLDNNVLTIKGSRKVEEKIKEKDYQRVERFSGTFCRQFTLPKNVDSSKIEAETYQGVLTVYIPKAKAATPQYITVKSKD